MNSVKGSVFFFPLQYVASLRELLEQLAEEKTPEGLPRFIFLPLLFFNLIGFLLGLICYESQNTRKKIMLLFDS